MGFVTTAAVFLTTTLLVAPGDAAYEIRSLTQERTLSLLDENSFYADSSTAGLSGEAFVDVCNAYLEDCRVRIDQSSPTVVGLLMELVDATGNLARTITDFFQRWSRGDATLLDIGPVIAVLFTELEIGQILGVLTASGDNSNPTSITEVLNVLLGGLLGIGASDGEDGEDERMNPGPISSLIDFFLGLVFADNEQRVAEAGYIPEDGNSTNTTVGEDIIDSLLGSIDLAQLELDTVLSQLIGLFADEGTADAIVAVVRVFIDILSILIPSGNSERRRELIQQLVSPSASIGKRDLKRKEKKVHDDDDDDDEDNKGIKTAKAELSDEDFPKETELTPADGDSNQIRVPIALPVESAEETVFPQRNPVMQFPDRGQPVSEESESTFPERGPPVSENPDETNNSFGADGKKKPNDKGPFDRVGDILESIKPRETISIPHDGHFHEISSLDENLTLLRYEADQFFDKLRAAAVAENGSGIFSADAQDPQIRGDLVDQFINLLNLDLIVTIVGGLTSLLGTLGGTSDPQGPFSYLASFIALVGEVLGQGEESNIFFSLSGLLQTIASLTVFQATYQYMEATFPRVFPDSIQPDLQLASEMIDVELSEILTLLQIVAAGEGSTTEGTMAEELDCRLELLACEASETVLHE